MDKKCCKGKDMAKSMIAAAKAGKKPEAPKGKVTPDKTTPKKGK